VKERVAWTGRALREGLASFLGVGPFVFSGLQVCACNVSVAADSRGPARPDGALDRPLLSVPGRMPLPRRPPMRSQVLLLTGLLALPSFAAWQLEDGKALCEDGIDNDSDGKTDCEEVACQGSSNHCPLPDKAFVFGLGDERALPDLDVPMVTTGGEAGGRDILLIDRDGSGPRSNDVVVGRSQSVAVFDNIVTPGKSSLPQTPGQRPVIAGARIAGGDYDGDGDSDLVAVSASGMQRYRGPLFSADGALVSTVPGPAGGHPAVSGTTVAVVNSRLRLYDQCSLAPAGFPTNETFGANGLCSSVAVPGGGAGQLSAYTRKTGQRMLAAVAGPHVFLFEIVSGSGIVDAVPRGTVTANADVNDLAFSQSEDLLVLALNNGFLMAANGDGTAPPAGFFNVSPSGGTAAFPPPLGHVAVGPLLAGQPTVVVTEVKGELLHVMPFSRAHGWSGQDATTKSWDVDPADRHASGLVLGQFNDDALLDIGVLDGDSGNVVILRQTPAPCATFITSASHGLVLFDYNAPSQEYLQRFSSDIHQQVKAVNAQRRPANAFRDVLTSQPALCPVRHIEVRGHWEKDALAELSYVGRAGWLGSMWVPAPSCQPVLPLPAFTPVDYWASAVFLLIPNFVPSDPICTADLPIPSDPLTRLRFGLAGVGYGLELTSLAITSQKALNAGANINAALRQAITAADQEMDRCNGHIYVDVAAHSRGAAVNSYALSLGFGPRADYNFDVSFTLVDGVDPSPQDNVRPFIHAGYIMGDPKIARRGSEWISSFHTHSSQGTLLDGLLWLVPPYIANNEYKSTEVVGLPVGRARRSELEDPARTFGAFEGPMQNLVHVEAMENAKGYAFVSPDFTMDNLFSPSAAAAPDAPSFALVTTSLLGRVLEDPRMQLPFDAVGFHTRSSFSAQDEARCMPTQCGGLGSCSDEVGATATALSQNSQGLVVRELVHDPDFRIATGLVRNARDLVSENGDLKGALNSTQLDSLRAYIVATAADVFPSGGRWSRSGTVTFPAMGPSLANGMRELIAAPGVSYAGITTSQQASAALDAWRGDINTNADQELRDRARVLSAAAARGTDGSKAWAQFPASDFGTLTQQLDLTSLAHDRFLVRVEYVLDPSLASTATLHLSLIGGGLSTGQTFTAADGLGRQVQQLIVQRSGPGGPTHVKLDGRGVQVYSMSVTPFFPVHSAVTGRDYELVAIDPGASFSTARDLAARRVWAGKNGRLARVVSTAQLDDLTQLLRPDVPAWVDGSSADGSAGSFRDSSGGAIASSLFRAGTSFTQPRPRGANTFAWPAQLGMRLGHSSPAVSVGELPLAFLVEY
jgi:hypothetical protein